MPSANKPRVIITISCCDIPAQFKGVFCTYQLLNAGYIHEKESVTTEIQESQNPDFEAEMLIDYVFEEKQTVLVKIYSVNEKEEQVMVGSASSTVGRIVHCGGHLTKPLNVCEGILKDSLTSNDPSPQITFHVKEDSSIKENVFLKLQGFGLDKKDLFGKSDPYMIIERKNDKGKIIQTYRTEIIKNTLNPDWKPLLISIDKLCNGEMNGEIYFRCFDWDGAKGDPEDKDTEFDDLIGEFVTTAAEILDEKGEERRFELINPRKRRRKKTYLHSGLVTVRCYRANTEFIFLDYMFGGTDLNFIVAIDMTSSNGDVNDPNSLHSNAGENEYSIAIQAVLEIITEYDNDQLFPAFAFGARVPPHYKVCHEYPLTGDYNNPFCAGADGVLQSYIRTLQEVRLAGPTHFAPVIRHVNSLAKDYQDGSHYFVLLILTDGTVDDWVDTKKAVIEASYLPVSIIVVGVGGGKFCDMEVLDQDFGLLKVGANQACRDNVQFVSMRRFLRPAADGSHNLKWSKVALAKEVLAELPEQVEEFLRRQGIPPRSHPPRSLSNLIGSYNVRMQRRRYQRMMSATTPNAMNTKSFSHTGSGGGSSSACGGSKDREEFTTLSSTAQQSPSRRLQVNTTRNTARLTPQSSFHM